MSYYVYSTLTGDTCYAPAPVEGKEMFKYSVEDGTHKILIKGGANLATRTRSGGLWTPRGAVTEITEKQKEALEINQHFIRHKDGGFVHIEPKKKKVETVVSNLTSGDKSQPFTPKAPPAPGVKEAEDPNRDKKSK